MSIGNDGSLQAIGEDAFKTILAEAALAQKSAEEISVGGALAATVPPFWPQPGRKPSFAVADADAGRVPAGAAIRPPLKTVTGPRSEAAVPQPPSDVRRPAGPGLERLRRRLKTISHGELKKQTAIKKKISEKKAEKREASAEKAEPLFLNRVVNSIGGLPGIDDAADEGNQEEIRNSGDPEDHASRTREQTGSAPAPAAKDLNPFDPAAVPEDARLPSPYAAVPKLRPVQPVKIVEIESGPQVQKASAGPRVNIATRPLPGASDTPPIWPSRSHVCRSRRRPPMQNRRCRHRRSSSNWRAYPPRPGPRANSAPIRRGPMAPYRSNASAGR